MQITRLPFSPVSAFVLVMIAVASSSARADETGEPPPAPKEMQAVTGSWRKTSGEEETVLEIQSGTLTMVSRMGMRGVTTLRASALQLSQDGVLFGVVDTVQWKSADGKSSTRLVNQLYPFAFRYRLLDEALRLTDVRLYGADAKGQQGMLGDYQRVKADVSLTPRQANAGSPEPSGETRTE